VTSTLVSFSELAQIESPTLTGFVEGSDLLRHWYIGTAEHLTQVCTHTFILPHLVLTAVVCG